MLKNDNASTTIPYPSGKPEVQEHNAETRENLIDREDDCNKDACYSCIVRCGGLAHSSCFYFESPLGGGAVFIAGTRLWGWVMCSR
ncbi:hypothetical protein F4678DRAFT_462880 [Xylaria arbuscula]|nr:hypothetical protein F4678DRAFT_462880 [Xylaria arbuscula]